MMPDQAKLVNAMFDALEDARIARAQRAARIRALRAKLAAKLERSLDHDELLALLYALGACEDEDEHASDETLAEQIAQEVYE